MPLYGLFPTVQDQYRPLELLEDHREIVSSWNNFLNSGLVNSLAMTWCVCDGWASCLRIIFNFYYVLLVLVNSRPANCDSLIELGQSSTSTNYSRFPEACLKRRDSCVLKYFGLLHLVLPRRKLSCEQLSFPSSLTTFTTHSFGRDWYIMMAWTCCGQVHSVLCILLRSSMNLMIHLPRFLCICNYFCFAGIVVETNCTLPIVEEMFVFLLYECVHPPYNFQSSFCNKVMISCSINSIDELYSRKDFFA